MPALLLSVCLPWANIPFYSHFNHIWSPSVSISLLPPGKGLFFMVTLFILRLHSGSFSYHEDIIIGNKHILLAEITGEAVCVCTGFVLFCFFNKMSQCRSHWSGTHYITQFSLKFITILPSQFPMLRLQV